MIFAEFEKLLYGPDMLRIIQGKKDVYKGYFGTMEHIGTEAIKIIESKEVVGFRAVPEIRHKKWKERGLDAPLMPQELPQYSFSDLMMTLYYTVYLKGETDGN